MPNIIKNVSKTVQKAINKSGFTLSDDRGNAINLPIKAASGGIFRTDLTNGLGIGDAPTPPGYPLVSLSSKLTTTDKYEPGFTPQEAYYRHGHTASGWFGPDGLNFEQGDIHITGKEGKDKIARTEISWNPGNANRPGTNTLSLLGQSLPDRDYNYGKYKGSAPQEKGWTDPFFYIKKDAEKNTISGLTDIPKEFGDNPKNIKPNWNKNGKEIPTTPQKMLDGDRTRKLIKDNNNNTNISDIGNVDDKIISGPIAGAEEVFNFFDNDQQYKFTHRLDRVIPDSTGDPSFRECYLGSDKKTITPRDNEDPTMLGYDITIKLDSSPLFNGSVKDFILNFGGDEVESRYETWRQFCLHFFNFFKIDQDSKIDELYSNINPSVNTSTTTQTTTTPNSDDDRQRKERINIDNNAQNIKKTTDFNKQGLATGNLAKEKELDPVAVGGPIKRRIPRTYYLKKISGLDNLSESTVSSNQDTIKSMVDYGKDVIKLSLYEDVSLSTGHLAMLYKTLSWSRFNGKQIIPENLLRFDAKIVITEIRDFNRIVTSFVGNDNLTTSKDLDVFADSTTRYTYTLYDCQFLFDNLSHGNDIDMSVPKMIDDFDISFNYKYSTLSLDMFNYSRGKKSFQKINTFIDNEQINPIKIGANRSNQAGIIDGSISHQISPVSINRYKTWSQESIIEEFSNNFGGSTHSDPLNKWNSYITSSESTIEKAKREDMVKKSLNTLGKKLNKAVANEVNRQITTQARLLNRTLDNIRDSVYLGRMSSPTNVYQKYFDSDKYNDIVDDTKNAFKDFIGQSVRGFFGP